MPKRGAGERMLSPEVEGIIAAQALAYSPTDVAAAWSVSVSLVHLIRRRAVPAEHWPALSGARAMVVRPTARRKHSAEDEAVISGQARYYFLDDVASAWGVSRALVAGIRDRAEPAEEWPEIEGARVQTAEFYADALILWRRGLSVDAVAAELGLSDTTVRRWVG